MGFKGRPVGPRGAAVLAVTAVAGLVLAFHGWSGRHSGLAPGALAAGSAPPSAPARSSPAAGPTSSAGPASSAGPTPAPSASGASPGARPGPLLSSQPFASFSFLVWPGPPSAAAQAALAGLSVSVHRDGAGISVTAGVNGQPATAPRFYPRGARVYVVEASMGDDSGNSDYNLGDDGLVVTDAQQRILARGGARPAAPAGLRPPHPPAGRGPLEQASLLAEEWAPTVARVLLGLVLAWFGYHELVQPSLWTGYVPIVPATSQVAIVLVLVHGWLLLVLAAAVMAGIALRAVAAATAVLLLEIVIGLTVTAGLSDLTLRDVGVLGLAVCLTGRTRQRFVLRG